MFEDWTLNSLEKLLYVVEMKTFAKDEHIFTQGDEAKGFYIVFRGDVLISHKIWKRYKEKLEIDWYLNNDSHRIQDYSKLDDSLQAETWKDPEEEAKEQANRVATYRQTYHSLVNNSQKVHSVSK